MNRSHPSQWKYSSPDDPGFHEVINPENSPCKETWIFRLNISGGQSYSLFHGELELNAALIKGLIRIRHTGKEYQLNEKDTFYLPANDKVEIEAMQDAILYIGGAECDGKGTFFTRKYDLSLPLGDIHQIHGKPPYRREVFMTLAQQDAGSRLICGITSGDPGMWTSWPPHQHSADLEEVYCFFDIPKPKVAFHYSSRKSGEFEFVHPVSTGDFVAIPEGYHPTCGMPGVRSTYFWVMAAFRPESRRYDLAIDDPNYVP